MQTAPPLRSVGCCVLCAHGCSLTCCVLRGSMPATALLWQLRPQGSCTKSAGVCCHTIPGHYLFTYPSAVRLQHWKRSTAVEPVNLDKN